MKNCKHYLLCALAGALLILPVTSHYAYDFSWGDIKEKINNFFGENTLQKIIPGTIVTLGVAGVLYYWWTKRGITEPITFEIAGRQVTQFPIYSQFNSDGGGAASCGYHTLLRGMQIVQAKANNESENDLKKTLMSYDLIAQYFGKNGTWRQAIVNKRKSDKYYGDWLNDGELEFLWKNYRVNLINQTVNCDFKSIADFALIGKKQTVWYRNEANELVEGKEEDIDPIVKNISEKLKEAADAQKNYFYLFAIGTMTQVGDQLEQEGGHWFTLVLHQNSNGAREYFVTDSFNNTRRNNDERVIKLITAIENFYVGEEI